MNLILFEQEEVGADGLVILTDRRASHIIKVLGGAVGDELKGGIIDGPSGPARIVAISRSEVVLAVSVSGSTPPRPAVDLILALPRPIMLKKILTQAATLGVGRIFLINANRVEKSFFTASLLREENYRPYFLHGLEQAAGDTRVPKLSIHPRFRPFVEDFLPEIIGNYRTTLVAHPHGEQGLAGAVGPGGQGPLLLAVGPEGGWVDFEVGKFKEQGLVPCGLGPRILRVDTAVVVLLGQLALLKGMADH